MGVPERIGRYQVLGELGQGAMGTVYRGRDEMLDRDVAVKVMSKGLADADARARFLREARAAARLQHPNIVVIYELGEHEGAPFMVLELLEGVDLQRAIDGGIRPDPRATLPVVLQLLAGLGHAHEHGIVHRDVKPSNVFLPSGRPAKIMDFGVARLAGLGTTTAGVVVGTPNYMSPEQVAAGELDGRSDLFSAGLILYELVTGEKAFQADSLVSIMYKILHEAPDLGLIPDGRQWERLRAVLARALARKASDRYPDARAMSAELGQALSDLGGTLDWSAPADQALLVRPKPTPRGAPTLEAPRPGIGAATPRAPAPRPEPARPGTARTGGAASPLRARRRSGRGRAGRPRRHGSVALVGSGRDAHPALTVAAVFPDVVPGAGTDSHRGSAGDRRSGGDPAPRPRQAHTGGRHAAGAHADAGAHRDARRPRRGPGPGHRGAPVARRGFLREGSLGGGAGGGPRAARERSPERASDGPGAAGGGGAGHRGVPAERARGPQAGRPGAGRAGGAARLRDPQERPEAAGDVPGGHAATVGCRRPHFCATMPHRPG